MIQEHKSDKYKAIEYVSTLDNEQYIPEIVQVFDKHGLYGMGNVKEQLSDLYCMLLFEQKRREELQLTEHEKHNLNYLILGNPGTGKTSVAHVISDILYSMDLVKENEVICAKRADLVGSVIGETEEKTERLLESAIGKTLFIDEAYTLYMEDSSNDFGKKALETILPFAEEHRGELCLIMAGYRREMNDMVLNANIGFASRFPNQLVISDYTNDELINILVKIADKSHYFIDEGARNAILDRIEREHIDETFANARFMRDLFEQAVNRHAIRIVRGDSEEVTADDFLYLVKEDFLLPEPDSGDCLAELDSLVGLRSAKQKVREMAASATIRAEQKRRGMKTAEEGTMHMKFVGSPGTGKTTVARLVGKIYNQLGILKRRDVFVECKRADLVGRYQGHSARNVKDKFDEAKGGILFIDEAYSLVQGENDSFGREAVDTLVAELDNRRDSVAVIIAGYTEEIGKFLKENPGLNSRFPAEIVFEDYSLDELTEIFFFELKRRRYDASQLDRELVKTLIEKRVKDPDFGNARGVRNLCEKTIRYKDLRLAERIRGGEASGIEDAEFITLLDCDIEKMLLADR